MQLTELQQRYFRDAPIEEITAKQGVFSKLTKFFDKNDKSAERRKSFLSDHSVESQDAQTRKARGMLDLTRLLLFLFR